MRPIADLSAAQARGVELLFSDIDGTITDEAGRIPAQVFAILEEARDAGLTVIPVTGRPAGWCDMIARTWPVAGVVGENGGLFFRRGTGASKGPDARMERIYTQDAPTRVANRVRLTELTSKVLSAFPGAALASDQSYREFDIAVDFCEDVPRLPESDIDGIVRLLEEAGCHVKVSDIHVNAWFGEFDKASMCRRVGELLGLDLLGAHKERAVYFGDSPNDAPLFAAFPLAIGVANVAELAHRMETLPAFVTEGRGSDGFVQGVRRLLDLRG
ncbi:MAG: HAD family phosphatase [Deltaproteobacteria bacterium]|nr:HAD family phosphatase [Deltaproteobacteria bacterium]